MALAGMAEVLKGQLSAAGLRAWDWALAEFPVGVIERACARFIRGEAARLEGQAGWMPVPEEVIAECRRIQEGDHAREVRQRTNIDRLLAAVDDEKAMPQGDRPKELAEAIEATTQPRERSGHFLRLVTSPRREHENHEATVRQQAKEILGREA